MGPGLVPDPLGLQAEDSAARHDIFSTASPPSEATHPAADPTESPAVFVGKLAWNTVAGRLFDGLPWGAEGSREHGMPGFSFSASYGSAEADAAGREVEQWLGYAAIAATGIAAVTTRLAGVAAISADASIAEATAASAAGSGARSASTTAAAESAAQATRSGSSFARQLGTAGETAAGIVKNTTRIPSLTGTANYRIPDVLNREARLIGEVKNVGSLSYTNQLRDFAAYAQQQGFRFELTVRQGTQLSGPLQQAVDAGDIILLRTLP
jgi:hypothetical protein